MGILSQIGKMFFVQNNPAQPRTALATLDSQGSRAVKNTSHSHMSSNIKYRDPVCSMWVTSEGAKASVNYHGTDYYFCGKDCADKFNKNPDEYNRQASDSESMNMDNMRQHKKRHSGCC